MNIPLFKNSVRDFIECEVDQFESDAKGMGGEKFP